MSDDIVTIDVKAVYERVLAALQDKYNFAYVAYDEYLSDEQVAKLLDPATHDEVVNEVYDAWQQNAWDYYLPETIKELVRDQLELAALQQSDYYGELMEQIRERDEGDPTPDLIRNTRNVLLRYHLGNPDEDQDLRYNLMYEKGNFDRNVERHARRLARMAGITWTEHDDENAKAFRQMVLEQSYYGGQLYVIWYSRIDRLAEVVNEHVIEKAGGAKAKRRIIRWTDPQLVLLDRFNGSGYGDQITGTISKVLDPSRLSVDSYGGGYGWDAVAGLHKPAFECEWKVK